MSHAPKTPVPAQIRRIIFNKFNNQEVHFTNDEVFDVMKNDGDVDPGWIIDDLEPFFVQLCKKGIMRNIAQNFTTMHFKLFEPLEELRCGSCGADFCGIPSEKACPSCEAPA